MARASLTSRRRRQRIFLAMTTQDAARQRRTLAAAGDELARIPPHRARHPGYLK
jgi:hypothetical protein